MKRLRQRSSTGSPFYTPRLLLTWRYFLPFCLTALLSSVDPIIALLLCLALELLYSVDPFSGSIAVDGEIRDFKGVLSLVQVRVDEKLTDLAVKRRLVILVSKRLHCKFSLYRFLSACHAPLFA
jgi:hypothetical protein